jgi:hypothetical protein
MKKAIPILVVLGAALALACSSSSSPATPCNENPWECPNGQTCWPASSGSFECLNSGPGTLGAACLDTVGVPTCSDGFACVQPTASGGACSPYCDNTNPDHACPAGLTCVSAEVPLAGGAQIQICAGGSLIGTGEGDASSGADSSSTPVDATVATGDASASDAGPGDASASETGAGDAASDAPLFITN